MNVLLIEDDKQDEEVIRRFMPPENHVECVRTLTKAIELVDEKPFHLILLDLGLPDSWGIETFTSLRAAAPLVPIVVLTGLDDDGLAVRTIREGAQVFFGQRPFGFAHVALPWFCRGTRAFGQRIEGRAGAPSPTGGNASST